MALSERKQPTIRQLPPNLINQIAAGEVIERPASVIKELLENSIDAGSTRIEVTVQGGGSELIRISDNGCGMTTEQLPLAIASHATSKLPDEDSLFNVATLGFRGEALASIGSVSDLTIRSRTESEDVGSEIHVRGGSVESPVPAGCPVGTVIEVRNLFFNTPVRHRFLKTAQTEKGHIVEAFTRLALANPQVHFVLKHNQKVLYDLSVTSRWTQRIHEFFGDEISEALIPIRSEDDQIQISGHVCDPSVSRGNNRMQYLFLNGRHIRDRALQHALSEAYRGLLMVGRHPVCFLRMDMPAEMIDVNVHPTKLEVRFTDSGRAYSRLLQSLRHEFLTTNLTQRVGPPVPAEADAVVPADANSIEGNTTGGTLPSALAPNGPSRSEPGWKETPGPHTGSAVPSRAVPSRLEQEQRQSVIDWARTGRSSEENQIQPSGVVPPFQPFPKRHDMAHGQAVSRTSGGSASSSTEDGGDQRSFDEAGMAKDDGVPSPSVCYLGFQVHNRYLVTQDETGMVVVDQHALHERVLYERVTAKVLERGESLETQRLLVPEPVSLTPAERSAALEARDALAKIGIEIDDFGGESILIQSCPAILAKVTPGDMLRTLLESVVSAGKTPDPKDLLNHLLATIACKAAVKAGDRLTPEEITSLLEQKDLYHDTHHCPHGRPTALFFSRDELDRMFGRMGSRGPK